MNVEQRTLTLLVTCFLQAVVVSLELPHLSNLVGLLPLSKFVSESLIS